MERACDRAMVEDKSEARDYAEHLYRVLESISERRSRLGDTLDVEALTPIELLEKFWQTEGMEEDAIEALKTLATEVLSAEED